MPYSYAAGNLSSWSGACDTVEDALDAIELRFREHAFSTGSLDHPEWEVYETPTGSVDKSNLVKSGQANFYRVVDSQGEMIEYSAALSDLRALRWLISHHVKYQGCELDRQDSSGSWVHVPRPTVSSA